MKIIDIIREDEELPSVVKQDRLVRVQPSVDNLIVNKDGTVSINHRNINPNRNTSHWVQNAVVGSHLQGNWDKAAFVIIADPAQIKAPMAGARVEDTYYTLDKTRKLNVGNPTILAPKGASVPPGVNVVYYDNSDGIKSRNAAVKKILQSQGAPYYGITATGGYDPTLLKDLAANKMAKEFAQKYSNQGPADPSKPALPNSSWNLGHFSSIHSQGESVARILQKQVDKAKSSGNYLATETGSNVKIPFWELSFIENIADNFRKNLADYKQLNPETYAKERNYWNQQLGVIARAEQDIEVMKQDYKRLMAIRTARSIAGTNLADTKVQYHTAVDGKTSGPFTGSEMLKMLRDGTITKDTHLWSPNMDSWQLANDVKEIKPLLGKRPEPNFKIATKKKKGANKSLSPSKTPGLDSSDQRDLDLLKKQIGDEVKQYKNDPEAQRIQAMVDKEQQRLQGTKGYLDRNDLRALDQYHQKLINPTSTAVKPSIVASTIEASKKLDTPAAIKTLEVGGKVLVAAGIVAEVYRGVDQISALPKNMPDQEYRREVTRIVSKLVAEFGLVYVSAIAGAWLTGLALTALAPGLGTIAGAVVGFIAGGASGYLALTFAGDSVGAIVDKIVAAR